MISFFLGFFFSRFLVVDRWLSFRLQRKSIVFLKRGGEVYFLLVRDAGPNRNRVQIFTTYLINSRSQSPNTKWSVRFGSSLNSLLELFIFTNVRLKKNFHYRIHFTIVCLI